MAYSKKVSLNHEFYMTACYKTEKSWKSQKSQKKQDQNHWWLLSRKTYTSWHESRDIERPDPQFHSEVATYMSKQCIQEIILNMFQIGLLRLVSIHSYLYYSLWSRKIETARDFSRYSALNEDENQPEEQWKENWQEGCIRNLRKVCKMRIKAALLFAHITAGISSNL